MQGRVGRGRQLRLHPACSSGKPLGAFRQVGDDKQHALVQTHARPRQSTFCATHMLGSCQPCHAHAPPQSHTPSLRQAGLWKAWCWLPAAVSDMYPTGLLTVGQGPPLHPGATCVRSMFAQACTCLRHNVCRIVTLPCPWQVAPRSGNLTEFSQLPCRDGDQPHFMGRGGNGVVEV